MIIELKLTVEEVNVLLTGLLELPAKTSIKLIAKIENDARSQIDEANKVK